MQKNSVSNLAKKCVDIVHEYNKKQLCLLEITGLELNHMGNILKYRSRWCCRISRMWSRHRMVSDMNVRIKEIRFLPYLFPDTFL